MKRILSFALAAAMTLSLAACGSTNGGSSAGNTSSGATNTNSEGKSYTLKIATTGNEDHQSTIAARAFAEKVEELSGGQIKGEVYPNSSLGS